MKQVLLILAASLAACGCAQRLTYRQTWYEVRAANSKGPWSDADYSTLHKVLLRKLEDPVSFRFEGSSYKMWTAFGKLTDLGGGVPPAVPSADITVEHKDVKFLDPVNVLFILDTRNAAEVRVDVRDMRIRDALDSICHDLNSAWRIFRVPDGNYPLIRIEPLDTETPNQTNGE